MSRRADESVVDLARAVVAFGDRVDAARLALRVIADSDRITELEVGLLAARDELAKGGWGGHHYGTTPQEQRVVDAVAAIDALLGDAPTIDTPETP